MSKAIFIAKPGKQEIVVTRIFDAPSDLVFKVYTNPLLIPLWWGPKRLTTTVDKMDIKPGGLWRFVQHDVDGNEFAFHGVYHQVLPPKRLVYTFEFEGMPGHVVMETVGFDEQDGKTKMRDSVVFQSVEDRDEMLHSGMEEGSSESMDRFTALLEKA